MENIGLGFAEETTILNHGDYGIYCFGVRIFNNSSSRLYKVVFNY